MAPHRRALAALLVAALPAAWCSAAPICVFGHKAPDTDAICAAMAYAWELEANGLPAKAYRLGELNPETRYVLEALGLEQPPLLGDLAPDTPVAIVDTNNPAELPDGVEAADIHSIVDHHKLSGLKTPKPIETDIRPLCSAGSILYARAKAAGRTPPRDVAALMLSCILSDSLEFRSPTTTPIDREYAAELAAIAGLDVHAHAEAMLNAKADIGHLSAEQLVMMDSKVFTIGGRKLRVSVLETTKPAVPLGVKAELQAAMRAAAAEQGLDDCLLFVVDILREEAVFLSSSESAARTVETAWQCTVGADGTVTLPNVLSRKKQIIPVLERAAAAPTLKKTGGEAVREASRVAA